MTREEYIQQRFQTSDPQKRKIWEKAYQEAIPISGTFELTPRCNFNCPMCYVHLKEWEIPRYGQELKADQWLQLAEKVLQAGTVWLCITGGEPLLYPEFPRLYRELSQMGFFITLQTNASLIAREENRKLLEEFPPQEVKITLYEADDAGYERACGCPGGFTQVDAGIQILKELGIPIQLVSILHRKNVDHIQGIIQYAAKNHLPLLGSGGLFGSARGHGTKVGDLKVREKTDPALEKQIQQRIKDMPRGVDLKPCDRCRDFRVGYWITWDGKMRFCSFLNEPQIDLRTRSFQQGWQELIAYQESLEWPEECASCLAREVCPRCCAKFEFQEGRLVISDSEFCRYVREIYIKDGGERL